ncbi:glutamine--fructose-6-phosphate transaminase (isomerizing) [Candidatus Liberibacter americanus]|uniref:Glutamine--fructose-6-phosphate aminotransferase [isomerizing] n=1 Tax=Candidatus Liberibacter americanus str. Sao Paulo TaxID=1261131 RepID=U6B4T7_9HYPH|nr:glutamine--fructose-6-phosphate transaminase (isomerizing) [Candidatus Liberibacter americanus]AHA28079.1 Glucosamine 6-phosphate synthetase [Candidatus Liberibacter americanus str. Sao Paulo]EMS35952.1 glucosamine--fructose-6-phosphate aminotransferase [Candidatus Liberibacter americanus PW_SP]
MCGIVGIIGKESVDRRLFKALKRLEYRGYDSSGMATINNGKIKCIRSQGNLSELNKILSENPLPGNMGIAHTRWATHGLPNKDNAHPHCIDGIAVIHNGIIENFSFLKKEMIDSKTVFITETDTEVIACILAKFKKNGFSNEESVKKTIKLLIGSYALAIIFENDPDTIIAARKGPPLIIGHGEGEMFLGSDVNALALFTDKVTYMEDGDWAIIKSSGVKIYDSEGVEVDRKSHILQISSILVSKGNYRHFMEKEIYEQPEAISRVLSHYVDLADNTIIPSVFGYDFTKISGILASSCGTSYLAGLIGKFWFERLAGLTVEIDVSSEFRYRDIRYSSNWASLFISQSGETADTLASLREMRKKGLIIGSLVNVLESSIAKESDFVLPIKAGPEIGVASTKAFSCQLLVLLIMAIYAGKVRGVISLEEEKKLIKSLIEVPRIMFDILQNIYSKMEGLCYDLAKYHSILYIGRGSSYPIAMEGALKLKEVSYIHAEGYAAGELKHGPIALINRGTPVIAIAPYDRYFYKTLSNIQEVIARGGNIIFITDEKGLEEKDFSTLETIVLPHMGEIISPIIFSLPVQLIAYYTAVFIGTDVDQPRNLAKSVTVE